MSQSSYVGNVNRDSLLKEISANKKDTATVDALNILGRSYSSSNFDLYDKYSRKALDLARSINYERGQASAINNLANLARANGDLKRACELYKQSLKISKKINDEKAQAIVNHNLGVAYTSLGDYKRALQYALIALRIREKLEDKKGVALTYNSLGIIYDAQMLYDKALDYYKKSIQIRNEIGDTLNLTHVYSNIAGVYFNKGDIDKSLEYQLKSMELAERTNDLTSLGNGYSNIGLVYFEKGDYKKSLEYQFKALEAKRALGDDQGIPIVLNNMGSIMIKLEEPEKAMTYFKESAELSRAYGLLDDLKESYAGLSEVSAKKGDYKNALEYFRKFADIKDSLFNEDQNKQLGELQNRYEVDKKQNEIELLMQKGQIKDLQLNRQKLVTYGVIGGLVLLLSFTILILRNYREKKKANLALTEAYQIIEEKNTSITDSINYAKRIQSAMLPSVETLKATLPNSFVFFKPKDIVSGDFYFFEQKNNILILAAADCTGHGVPGALMSMICIEHIQDALEKTMIPGEILEHINISIKNALGKSDENISRDGMDIALCCLNLQTAELLYSGANRPLWLIKEKELREFRPTKCSIGGFTHASQKFETVKLNLTPTDKVYMFSDGFADQFGGKDGKKFMSKNMKSLLVSISEKHSAEQHNIVEETFNNYKGTHEQVDDILVMGFRI